MVKDGQGWSRIVKDGQGWSGMVRDGQGWSRMEDSWSRLDGSLLSPPGLLVLRQWVIRGCRMMVKVLDLRIVKDVQERAFDRVQMSLDEAGSLLGQAGPQ